MSDLAALQSRLGYAFRDETLLRLALTHPSVAHEQGVPVQHNQRLEFLGDAVLQLALTRELYERFPAFNEGPLTKARAKLVNRRALADAYEALVGAMFLDGGFEAAREFILREFAASVGHLNVIPILENPKGELQEFLQARSPEAPVYQVVSATGPDHDRLFECTVLHEGVELARGSGKSKKAAQSEAALAALRKLREQVSAPIGDAPAGNRNDVEASGK